MGEEPRLPIVALGVSAGGIEALEAVLRGTPPDSGLGFVVIAHLAPERRSMMAEILQRFTAMPVREARDGDEVEPNHLYVNQGGTALTIEGGRLRVQSTTTQPRERHPIDVFFGSLAEDLGELAIGVVLSGGGSDGALGVKAIKERGGLTVAQGSDGSAPQHKGMPSSAIATGLVDLVVPAEQIGARLAEVQRGPGPAGFTKADEDAEGARLEVCEALRNRLNHDFSGYKPASFMRRVRRRMQVRQLGGLDDYVAALRSDADEALLLFRDLLIGVTNFFRDGEAFEALDRQVVGPLFDGKGADDAVRIWVPGCATGEEAYSLAMLACERMNGFDGAPKVQIFATDIDEAALAVARNGRYPAALLDSVSPERLQRFFVAESGSYVVAKPIRDLCIFSSHSLVRDPPFSRMDLISCRNLLIYIGGELQNRLSSVFHYALRPGGVLFLGSAENVAQEGLFEAIDKKHRIFRRRGDVANAGVTFPSTIPSSWRRTNAQAARFELPSTAPPHRLAVEARVLERFAPPHVLVNRDGEVLHYSERTGKYLEAASGQPSRQLDALSRKGLRLELRSALKEAIETLRPTIRGPVGVEFEDRIQSVRLHVEPLAEQGEEPLFLVLFVDLGPPMSQDDAPTPLPRDGDAAVLERELRDARERQQATVEEYETALEELKAANEELVSVNEEMQSANEELETSKEEIQAVNEELQTVNGELQGKVDELDRANADLRNLFESTQIATLFLDPHMIVRSFTPAAAPLFNLISADRGRPITDFAHRLKGVDLRGEIERALNERTGHERRISNVDGGSHYLMRVLPYRTADDAIDGVLITLIDVTNVARAEEQQRVLVAELNHRVRNMLAVVGAIAINTVQGTRTADEVRETFLGRLQALAKAHSLVSREEWNAVQLADVLRTELEPSLIDGRERVRLDGPPVPLRPNAAVALAMVTHELATNALKYGALSATDGRVEVTWGIADGNLNLKWREIGGPPVTAPDTRGFGSTLVERQLRYELDAAGALDFAQDGVHARITIPMSRLTGPPPTAERA